MRRIKDLTQMFALGAFETDHQDLTDGHLTLWYSTDGQYAEQRLLKPETEALQPGDLYYGFMQIPDEQIAVVNYHYVHNLRTGRVKPALRDWPQGFRAILSGTAYVAK